MRWNVIKIDLHVSRLLTRTQARAIRARIRISIGAGTLFGVAKSLIKVRLAGLTPVGKAVQDSGRVFSGPGFIKRDLIRGCQDPFRVCFQLVFTTELSLCAFRIIDTIICKGWKNSSYLPTLESLFTTAIVLIIVSRLVFQSNFYSFKIIGLSQNYLIVHYTEIYRNSTVPLKWEIEEIE